MKNIQARLVASSAWQQLVTAVKTLFSQIVIVEIIINGYIGARSDDDGKDDNHGDQTMKKRCYQVRGEVAAASRQAAEQLNGVGQQHPQQVRPSFTTQLG